MNIKKGDNIIVIAGKDKGKKAKVLKVFRDSGKVLVEGINMTKKHQKPRGNVKGQTVDMAMPMQASNVMLIDPKSGKQTRAGSKTVSGKKIRVSRKSDQEI
jgi:large subunit ribosomal protein L24